MNIFYNTFSEMNDLLSPGTSRFVAYDDKLVVSINYDGFVSMKIILRDVWDKISDRIRKCDKDSLNGFEVSTKTSYEEVVAFRLLFGEEYHSCSTDQFEVLEQLIVEDEFDRVDEKEKEKEEDISVKTIVVESKKLADGTKVYVMKNSVRFILEPTTKEVTGIYQVDGTIRKISTLEEIHIAKEEYNLSLSPDLVKEEKQRVSFVDDINNPLLNQVKDTSEECSNDINLLSLFAKIYDTKAGFDIENYKGNHEELVTKVNEIFNEEIKEGEVDILEYLKNEVDETTRFYKVILRCGNERPYILHYKDITYLEILEATRVFSHGKKLSIKEFKCLSYNVNIRGIIELEVCFRNVDISP